MTRSRLFVTAFAALAVSGVGTSVAVASVPPGTEPASSEPAAGGWSVAIGGDVDSPISVTADELAIGRRQHYG